MRRKLTRGLGIFDCRVCGFMLPPIWTVRDLPAMWWAVSCGYCKPEHQREGKRLGWPEKLPEPVQPGGERG